MSLSLSLSLRWEEGRGGGPPSLFSSLPVLCEFKLEEEEEMVIAPYHWGGAY